MAHHKRRRPKHQRNGCLYCKPHKDNHAKDKEHPSVKRRIQEDLLDLRDEAVLDALDHDCGPECGLWEGVEIEVGGEAGVLTEKKITDFANRIRLKSGT